MLCYDVYMYYMYCYSHDMSQAITTTNKYHSLLLYQILLHVNYMTCHDMCYCKQTLMYHVYTQ